MSAMKTSARFYHAGCPVCVAAEQGLGAALDDRRFTVETIHLGREPARVAEAEAAGVKSVPAIVIGAEVYHVNFGAALADLRKA